MDSVRPASPSTSTENLTAQRVAWGIAIIALIVYGILLATHVGAYAGGSDSSGYMNHARLLGQGHVHVQPRALPDLGGTRDWRWIYSALGFKPAPDGDGLVPTYPTGLPLLVLGAAQVVGWTNAGNVVLWIHGMAGVLLAYATGRSFGLSRRWSVVAAVIVAASPLYLFMTLQAMSDVPALVWTTAAVLAAWRSRERPAWAIAAGAAYALAVLIRPTNVLALVPILIALGKPSRRWAWLILGGVPGAAFLLLHNHAAYGKFVTTGYGDTTELARKWIVPALVHYARWLPVLFTPVVIAFLALPALARRNGRQVLVLGTWVVLFFAFYSAYYFTHETWWYLRFILPAVPALVVGGLLVAREPLAGRISARTTWILWAAALLLTLGSSRYWTKQFAAIRSGDGEFSYVLTAYWAKDHLPPNAAVAAMQTTGALFYYTDFTFFRWDMLHGEDFRRVAAAAEAAHRPIYAILEGFEINDQHAFSEHMIGGVWKQVGKVRDTTIWQWSPAEH